METKKEYLNFSAFPWRHIRRQHQCVATPERLWVRQYDFHYIAQGDSSKGKLDLVQIYNPEFCNNVRGLFGKFAIL